MRAFTPLALLALLHITAATHFKGDPGDLGDTGVDLTRYAKVNSRTRRFLSFPSSTTLTFQNKLKVPVFKAFDSNLKGTMKAFIKAKYTLPSDTITVGRANDIDHDRFQAYNSIENLFTNFGINGRQCVLKAICETADSPGSHLGLVGELLGLVLSPNHNLDGAKSELRDYSAAEVYGRDVGNCELAYNACPFNLPELLNTGVSLIQGSMGGFSLI